eukprot:351893-Chlamydomonas_euryale.AAC.22
MHSSKVYTRLQDALGLSDHAAVLNAMLSKIAKNLQFAAAQHYETAAVCSTTLEVESDTDVLVHTQVYGSSEELVHLTLMLFQDLANGYMSGKLLLKLDAIGYLLNHHTAEYYAFLDHPANTRNRCASQNATQAVGLRQDILKGTIIGLFRDLRGIAAATNSRRTYGALFEWLYPAHLPVIIKCLEPSENCLAVLVSFTLFVGPARVQDMHFVRMQAWADVPEVTTPLLKFMAEFVFNKSTRLTFDASSPNGILLFREVSKVMMTYGSRVLMLTSPSKPYEQKHKGIWICLLMVARSMSGNYVNFGVFELYGDPALKVRSHHAAGEDALDMALRLVLSIPMADLLAFRKVQMPNFAFSGAAKNPCWLRLLAQPLFPYRVVGMSV